MHDASDDLRRGLDAVARMWEILVENGLVPGTEVEVDFFYARRLDRARALADVLRQWAYTVAVQKHGTFLRRSWLISGSTCPMSLTPESLEQWTASMVALAQEHGAVFDGCGTAIVGSEEPRAPA